MVVAGTHETIPVEEIEPDHSTPPPPPRIREFSRIANLTSHILAIMRRRLPDDWTKRYNITSIFIETFVQTPRYTRAVYKPSGWIRVGTTRGRGRYDTHNKHDKPKKHLAGATAQGLKTHPQPVTITA